MVFDVGFEPRLPRRPAAALIRQVPLRPPRPLRHQPARLLQLLPVVAHVGHGERDAVGGKDQAGCVAPVLGHGRQRLRDPLDHRLDEARMVEEEPQFVDLGRVPAHRVPRVFDVFQVLPAARIGAEGRSDQRQRPPHAVGGHLPQRVGEERVPVAVAPIDRPVRAVGVELGENRGQQGPVLLVDRTDPAEQKVVLGDLLDPLGSGLAPAQHVLQKGNHVVGPLRPAKRDKNKGIVGQKLGMLSAGC